MRHMSDYDKYKEIKSSPIGKINFPIPDAPDAPDAPEEPEEIGVTGVDGKLIGFKDPNGAPKHKDFAVVSPCFYKRECEMQSHLRATLAKENIEYIPYGEGEKFTNKVDTNIIQLYYKLQEIEDRINYVLIVDAFDTLYLGGHTALMLLSNFFVHNKKRPIVILASEKDCKPDGSEIFYADQINKDGRPKKFLNSGLILGPTDLIKLILKEMIVSYDLLRYENVTAKDKFSESQTYWHRYYNEGKFKNSLYVDDTSNFFHCLDSRDPHATLEYISPIKIKVREHKNSNPKFFHFNGCFDDDYKYLFGEFCVENQNDLRQKSSPNEPALEQ